MTTQRAQLAVRDQVRPLAAVPSTPAPVRVEPAGPRAVALALVRLGLVSGDRGDWIIVGVTRPRGQLCGALNSLVTEGAIDPMTEGPHCLSEHGERLYGPDLRQRQWLSTR